MFLCFHLKVKCHQQWYVTHRLEVVYLHAKYEKPILNDKKVTARTRFVMDAETDLTLRSKFKVKGHQQWYATHRLEVVYLHVKYAKPVFNDKKVTARTRFVTDAQTDRLITIGHPGPCVHNKSCPGCNFFVIQDRLFIFGM
jgi:acyl-CoA thioesterase FadM